MYTKEELRDPWLIRRERVEALAVASACLLAPRLTQRSGGDARDTDGKPEGRASRMRASQTPLHWLRAFAYSDRSLYGPFPAHSRGRRLGQCAQWSAN